MIKVNNNTPAFLVTGEETQTSSKVGKLVVNYHTYLGYKNVEDENLPQGYIQSFVYNETMNSIMSDLQEDNLFTSNILYELTEMYITRLKALNPGVTFTNTLTSI
jgi:hypothetical protein